jgi:hypothetical protein
MEERRPNSDSDSHGVQTSFLIASECVKKFVTAAIKEAARKNNISLNYKEKRETINMEGEDRNYFKEEDFEKRRKERRSAFGIGKKNEKDDEPCHLENIDIDKNVNMQIEEAYAAKEVAERKQRDFQRAKLAEKRGRSDERQKRIREEDLEADSQMSNKLLLSRYRSVSRSLTLRVNLAKRNIIANMTSVSPHHLQDIDEVIILLKKLDTRLVSVRDILLYGPNQDRKSDVKKAREFYSKKFKAKRKWSPAFQRKKAATEKGTHSMPLKMPTQYTRMHVTAEDRMQIEKDIAARIDALQKDAEVRNKRAKNLFSRRQRQWSDQRLQGTLFSDNRLQLATEARLKAERLAEATLVRCDPHPLVSTLFRRLGMAEQDRLVRVALVGAGEPVPRDSFTRRDALEQWLRVVNFRRRDAPIPPRTIQTVEHFIHNLKRSHQMNLTDESAVGDLAGQRQIVTKSGRAVRTPVVLSPLKTTANSSHAERTTVRSVNDRNSFRKTSIIVDHLPPHFKRSPVRKDEYGFGMYPENDSAFVLDDTQDEWRRDFKSALKTAREVRNCTKKRQSKHGHSLPQLSPLKFDRVPVDSYDGRTNRDVLANETLRQAKIETMKQTGFLWDESEDHVYGVAAERRARPIAKYSDTHLRFAKEEYEKFESELAAKAEAERLKKYGPLPPEEPQKSGPPKIIESLYAEARSS